jgi:hypothetical protein
VLEEIRDYNKLYSIVRTHMMPSDYVDGFEASSSMDSTSAFAEADRELLPLTYTTLTFTATGGASEGLLTGQGTRFQSEVEVGDVIVINNIPLVGSGIDSHHVVTGVLSETTLTMTRSAVTNLLQVEVTDAYLQKVRRSSRARLAQIQASVPTLTVDLRLLSNFLNNEKFIPLMFLRNLQIEIELENPNYCMVAGCAGAGMVMNYTVSNPRFVGTLITPSEAVKKQYLDMFNGAGIPFQYISALSNVRNISPATAISFQVPASCRSARAMLMAKYYSNSDSVDATYTPNYQSISTTVKDGATYYQFRIGSNQYPSYGRANTQGASNGEALSHVMMALGKFNQEEKCCSMKWNNYLAINNVADVASAGAFIANESRRFVVGELLAKGGTYTGLDVSNNQILFDIDSTGVQPLYMRSYILYDKLLLIKSDGISVRF